LGDGFAPASLAAWLLAVRAATKQILVGVLQDLSERQPLASGRLRPFAAASIAVA
jgi:hypothetical protein